MSQYQDPATAANPYSATSITPQGGTDPLGLNSAAGVQPIQAPTFAAPTTTLNYQYPTYPNAAGLGSQNPSSGLGAPAPSAGSSNSNYTTEPVTAPNPTASSQGANPWSWLGEANARDVAAPISTAQTV